MRGEKLGFRAWEKELRIGPGWLGPNSPNRTLRTLNFGLATQWYYQQIINLAEGKPPVEDTGLLRRAAKHMIGERKLAKRRVARNN